MITHKIKHLNKFNNITILFLIIYIVVFSSLTFSQTAENAAIVSSFNVDPGLMGRTISNQPTHLPTTAVRVPSETQAVRASGIQPSEAKKVSFVLHGVTFQGNCVFNNQELFKIFKPYINKKITLEKFILLVQQVTDKYQKAGYFLSKAIIPPQKIDKGIVKVRILEGFINDVKVEGDFGRNKPLLLQYGEAIKALRPIRVQDLEHYLLLMNDIPGVSVRSVLSADPKVQLGSTLTLLTQFTDFNLIATYDNYQTLYLGPFETTVNAFFNSLLFPGGTFFLRGLSANTYEKLNYFELRHDQIFAPCGLVLGIDAFMTKTHPGFILEPLEIFGSSADGNLSLSYPWIRQRARNLTILAQFDYMNNASNALGEQLYSDKIRDLLLGFQYNESIFNGTTAINASIDKGFNILNADSKIHSRLGSSPDFFKFNITATRTQIINDQFNFFILITAQYSEKPLFAAEQMIFGGPYLGRGYDLAQFAGDQGIAGTFELRINTNPEWKMLKQAQFYGFYDAGEIWALLPGNFPTIDESGASTGIGVRAIVMKNLSFDAFLAKPLTTPNATDVLQGKSGKAWQKYFQITGSVSI